MSNFLAAIAIFFVSVFFRGYAASCLWGWFVVPLGVPAIGFAQAAGLNMLFLAFMGSRGADLDSEFNALRSVLVSVLAPALTLGFGWCVHWLMLHA